MSTTFRNTLALCSLMIAQQSVVAEVPTQLIETPRSLLFGAPPTVGHPILSPDGARLAFVQQNQQGVSMLRSLSFADGEIVTIVEGEEDGYDIHWCEFANETRILCALQLRRLPGGSTDYRRLVAINIDGTERREVPDESICRRYDDLRGQPRMDRLPDHPEQIMLLCGGTASLLDIYTGRITEVSGAGEVGRVDDRGQQLYSNGHGLGNLYRGRDQNIDRWFVRNAADSAWEPLLETDLAAFESPFRPVGFGSGLDRVFNIAWDPSTQAWSLYRKNLSGDQANQLVFAHGAANIELVDTMGPHDRVVAAALLDGRSQRAVVDRRVAEVFQYLSELLPELDIEIMDESWDRSIYLARARAPNSAGELLLVDMDNELVQSLGAEYDHLTGYLLSETRLIRFESSTGGSITAHLTLPVDVEWPAPAVVLPRSRASHENVADPHYLAQFLTASGYVVLRVDNRVEEEFGRGWLPQRAVVGWHQSAADIRDAAAFLVESGFSEPDTICGAGKDYGSYVVLMSAIRYPDLFRCVVSIAGVTDPQLTPGASVIGQAVGGDVLDEASPVRRAAELGVPTLMFHGQSDAEFGITDHAVPLANALEAAGKDIVLVEYPGAAHAIERGPYRIDMLARMRGFLAEQIGPPLTEEDAPIEQELRWRPSVRSGR